MKKLLFTAIAMIAFSNATMANTIAEGEGVDLSKVNNEANITLSLVRVTTPCESWAAGMASADEAEFGCMSSSEYNSTYYDYLNHCNSH